MQWRFWLVLLFVWIFVGPLSEAQSRRRPPPVYKTWGEPDQAEGRSILESFRDSAVPAGIFLEFSLRTYGAQRPEVKLNGRLWGGQSLIGPASLIEIDEAEKQADAVRFLIQNGPFPNVFRSSDDGTMTEVLTGETLSEPLFGTDVTPFDLQLPYVYWEDFVYEGVTRFRGRPTEVFLLYPPEDERNLYPGIVGVRLYLDAQFTAMMQAEILDENLEVQKKISLLEIKKVDGTWLAKTIDIRTSDGWKTRFRVVAASVNNRWGTDVFAPVNLLGEAPVLSGSELTPVR